QIIGGHRLFKPDNPLFRKRLCVGKRLLDTESTISVYEESSLLANGSPRHLHAMWVLLGMRAHPHFHEAAALLLNLALKLALQLLLGVTGKPAPSIDRTRFPIAAQ